MGQAKIRGTFEQRRKQAIQLKITKAEKERQSKIDWWNSLTDEQKEGYTKEQEEERKAGLMVAQMLGFVMADMMR